MPPFSRMWQTKSQAIPGLPSLFLGDQDFWDTSGMSGVSQVALVAKNPPVQCRRHKRCGFDPWIGKIPRGREWQPTPVFLPGESHGQRSLAGYNPCGPKELDMTEDLARSQSAHSQQKHFLGGEQWVLSGKDSKEHNKLSASWSLHSISVV